MGFATHNRSYRLRLNLLAKIGLLWYEINDFSNAKKPTALRTVPRPKLIGTDHLVLAKTKPAVFYCQMRQAELENSVFMNSLFDLTNSLFRWRAGKSCATRWDCSTNRDRERIEVTTMVRNFENSLLISLLSGN